MIVDFKDADGNVIGTFNVGDNPLESYIGTRQNGTVVASYEIPTLYEDNLSDRELTEKKDGELRKLIADLTARVSALENP